MELSDHGDVFQRSARTGGITRAAEQAQHRPIETSPIGYRRSQAEIGTPLFERHSLTA